MTDIVNITEPLVADFNRDRWGRPLIIPPDGGKPEPYKRPSSWGKLIEDMYGINLWEKRCIVAGISRTPSLIARTLAIPMDPKEWSKTDKEALNLIADEAKTAARANQAADIGTALHRMTERVDVGEALGPLPEPYESDIIAYVKGMTQHGLATTPPWVECRLVCDELKLAGTADRIVTNQHNRFIFDLKTGESIELAALGFAVQLAVYAHSALYNVTTGEREHVPVNQKVALIGHLPAGKGEFTIHQVDIEAGWQAALLAADIDRWRKRKNFLTPFNTKTTPPSGVREARQTNLRQRCHTIVAMSQSAADMLRINLGVAQLDLREPLNHTDLDAVEMIVQAAEREANAPFQDFVVHPA